MTTITFAFRMLRKTPGLAAVAVLCLAVAIGLTTAAFTVIHGAFLSPLPIPGGGRLVMIHEYHRAGGYNLPISAAQFTARRERSVSFDGIGAWYSRNATLGGDGRDAATSVMRAAHVSANTFDILEVAPLLGRLPAASDVAPGASPVVLLGHALWRNRFGGDPTLVGRSIQIAGTLHAVIGVMPERFAFPIREEAWIPVQMDSRAANATQESLTLFGRLAREVDRQEAAAELAALAASERRPDEALTTSLVMPFTRGFMTPANEWAMYGLLVGLIAFLAITAANVANLFLARNSARSREIAVRSALGAGRRQLVTHLLVESLVLGGVAALAGLLIARMAVAWFLANVADLPWWADFSLNPVVLGFTAASALIASAVAGAGPAFKLTRPSVSETLKASGPSAGLRFSRAGAALLVLQVAVSVGFLSVVSVLVQGLFGFSFQRFQIPGEDVLIAQVYLGRPEESELARPGADRRDVWQRHFQRSQRQFEAMVARLSEQPGVRHVTLATQYPGNDVEAARVELARGPGVTSGVFSTRVAEVGPNFFETLGARLALGRDFTAAERTGPPRAVIVNVPFARKYFPGESPLGKTLRLAEAEGAPPGPWLEIVGVAPDLGLNPGDPDRADGIYLSFTPSSFARLAIRTDAEPTHLIPRLHEIVLAENAKGQIQAAESLASQMNTAQSVFRGLGLALVLVGGTALLLSAVSFYSLVSFQVTQRTREIGIRVALGASPARILKSILGREMTVVCLGGAAGVLLGVGLYQLVSLIPFDLRPAGPSVLAAFIGLLLLVGVGACLGPARRATRLDPLSALRHE